MVGFVLLPAFLYALGVREKNITLIRVASVFGVLGIVVNRFNVCLVAFNCSWTARIATSRASRKCSCPSLS